MTEPRTAKKIYLKEDVGCYADGSFGWDHVRARLADLVESLDANLADDLRSTMTDDAGEEEEALDLLQDVTESGLVWMLDGDLLLVDEAQAQF